MKNKILRIAILVFCLFLISGCGNKDSEKFKKDYESLNGVVNKSGKEHRTLNIDSDNPFKFVKASDIVKKIEKGETFYVYFGSKLCPWCRSVLEKAIEISKKNNIDKIYYVDIWDDEGNEILRDKYIVNDDKEATLSIKGKDEYYKLLEYFDDILSDYNIDAVNSSDVTKKRIYAPNFIYVEKGVAKKLTTGISDKQKDSREELTEEMLKDEEELFNEFFNN